MKKLKLFNGGDWNARGGHLYVAAYSVKDAVDLVNEAYRKLKGHADRPDIAPQTVYDFNVYWHKNAWGNQMSGITPERGVWWVEQEFGPGSGEKPKRLL